MSDTDEQKLKAFAEAIRSKADTPQAKAFVENVIARIERSDAYYTALGNFVNNFSQVETTLQHTLWMVSGVKADVAPAIFSGLRVEGCLQFLRRIADAKKWNSPKKQALEEIIARLGPINKLRNDILHYGATMDLSAEHSWLISNRGFAHTPQKIREFLITPSLLDNVSSDLRKLFYLIIVLGLRELFGPKGGAWVKRRFAPFLKPAWLYKPPPQAKTVGKNRKTHRKLPRRQPPSRGKP